MLLPLPSRISLQPNALSIFLSPPVACNGILAKPNSQRMVRGRALFFSIGGPLALSVGLASRVAGQPQPSVAADCGARLAEPWQGSCCQPGPKPNLV